MNIQQAKSIIEQLNTYLGAKMMPYNTPIKGFVIVPNEKAAYDQMLHQMHETHISFAEAIQPYEKDVTVIAYFDGAGQQQDKYCTYNQFATANNLNIQYNIAG